MTPGATEVTTPVVLTLAAAGTLLRYTTVVPGSTTPATFRTVALNCTAMPAPTSVVSCGSRARLTGRVPAVAVALNRALSKPAAVTETDCAPSGSPSTQRADARPVASVVPCTCASAPAPDRTVNASTLPTTGCPAASSARTTSGSGRVSPCSAVCALPVTITSRGRLSTTTGMPRESAPYDAVTVVVPSAIAVTRPAESTRAMRVSADVNRSTIDGSSTADAPVAS